MKPTVILIAALSLTLACGKKKEDAAQQTPPPTAPAKVCDKGQVADGDTCVAVVTPQAVEAVKAQASQLDALTQKFEQVELLAKPIEILADMRQLSAWKTFASKGGTAAKVDEMVDNLDKALVQLRALKAQFAASAVRVGDLATSLEAIYDGSGAARTLADARTKVSAEITAAIEPLQAQVDAALTAIEPALADLEQLKEIVTGVCALIALNGGDDAKTLCDTGKDAFAAALTFVQSHKDDPRTLLTDLSGKLSTDLEALVTSEAKQLLDNAQKAVDDAVGAPAK